MPPKGNVQVKEKKEFTLEEALAKAEAQGVYQDDTLNFYSTFELPYGVFSNFWAAPFIVNKIMFKTSEHYFQALKFLPTDEAAFKAVLDADSCMDVTKIGRDRTRILRPDWEQVKIDVMYDALTAKYLTHEALFKILMSTGTSEIVEHTVNDKFWGDGGNYEGGNWLGKLLVKLREQIRSTSREQRQAVVKALDETGVNLLRAQTSAASSSSTAAASHCVSKKNEDQFQ